MVEQYGVSRASLREALRLLEVQGLIRLKPGPGGGPVVGVVEAANLARTASRSTSTWERRTTTSSSQTQVLMEPLCAQLAAQHPDRREVMEPFFEPGPLEPEAEYRVFTVDFHNAVYRLADNLVLTPADAIRHPHRLRPRGRHHGPVELRPTIADGARHDGAGHRRRSLREGGPGDGRALRGAARLLPRALAGSSRPSSSSGAEPPPTGSVHLPDGAGMPASRWTNHRNGLYK